MNTKASPIGDLLQKNPLVQQLIHQRQQDIALLAIVREQLPSAMQIHCVDVKRNGTHLTLYLDSPAWLTRLRFMAIDLAAALTAHEIRMVTGRICLNTHLATGTRSVTRSAPRITATAAAHLREAAAAETDPELSALFMRLASRHVADSTTSAD
ncbi:DciA family protein [Chromatium okenii]|uniref:DUF721 domain-containing protein n=1 Tax=Chromatium okenii TaxID=61644 RepID=A0A2S7XP40_9GAMM|nr:DciA family protein [Chromatium okenii]PQJ95507.1 hypothetical protein CXB77_15165 [Chromatium okenii]